MTTRVSTHLRTKFWPDGSQIPIATVPAMAALNSHSSTVPPFSFNPVSRLSVSSAVSAPGAWVLTVASVILSAAADPNSSQAAAGRSRGRVRSGRLMQRRAI